jgi:hypothetical protein
LKSAELKGRSVLNLLSAESASAFEQLMSAELLRAAAGNIQPSAADIGM